MPLEQFVRNFPLRACEVTRVARSMDENEMELEICQSVKGQLHDFKMHFIGVKFKTMPWTNMKVQRCRVLNGTFELVDEKGHDADVSFKECLVTYEDSYEKAFRG
ncbi:MAG: hypothetical protein GC165_16535 [Armatimonadetes bacterium]|nr:hypothetical protein [Armatimonadota bacterium]